MTTVTQDTIARKLGLTRQAVSLALSTNVAAHRQVRPETRQRIIAAAQKLGYVPHRAAQSLARGKTGTIVLATHSTLRSYETSDLVEELEVGLTAHGYHLNLELLHHARDEESIYRTFAPGQCDGVIKYDIGCTDEEYQRLVAIRRRGLPVVMVGLDPRRELDLVTTDVVEGVRLATAHLLDRGYRRIACVVDRTDCYARQQRLRGYRLALKKAGVAYDEALVFPGHMGESPAALWDRIAVVSPSPTAISCYNPELTLALFWEMRRRGVRVPEDVGMIAGSDLPFLEFSDVPMTSVDNDRKELAAAVISRLLAQIANPAIAPEQIEIKPFLIERASSRRAAVSGQRSVVRGPGGRGSRRAAPGRRGQ